MERTQIILLHEHPEYLGACSDLLNAQWKRSFSARSQSLERSFKDLPDSLLLLEEVDSGKRVIGHSRLTRILEDKNGCWIGSVVIAGDKRKKGYGKYLMQKTEEHAQKLNFSTAYLNTHDQQGFYEHLGYIYCQPVSSISFNGLMKMNMLRLNSSAAKNNHQLHKIGFHEKTKCDSVHAHEITPTLQNSSSQSSQCPAPPPPPLPPNTLVPNTPLINSNLGQFWMKKSLGNYIL